MAEQDANDVVSKADVALLLSVVRARFLNLEPAESNAIVLAIEGLRWLLGTESAVNRPNLTHEFAYWEEHSIISTAPEWP